MLDEFLRLREAGFAVLLLKPKSKIPFEKKWASKPVMSLDQLEEEYRKGDNAGVRLGKPSKVRGKYLYLVDMDIRDEKYLKQAQNQVKLLLERDLDEIPAVISGSGGESRHFYFLSEREFTSKKVWHSDEKFKGDDGKDHWCAEVEFFGTGKQAVLPPSIHPDTLKAYRWDREFDPADLPVIDADLLEAVVGYSDADYFDADEKQPLDIPLGEAREYLETLQDWADDHETWRNVGMALKFEYGEKIGWTLFDEWSKRGKGYDRDSNMAQFRAFRNQRKNPITMASIIQASNEVTHTIDREAILAEFEDDPVEEKEPRRPPGRVLLAEFGPPLESTRDKNVVNEAKALADIPPHLLSIPGALGIFVKHYNQCSRMYQPQFAVQTALALGSTVCGRYFTTEFNNYTAMYFMNVGETGSGKEYTRGFIRDCLREAGLAGLMVGEKYASDVGMISAIYQRPRHISIQDEVGLTNAANSKDNQHFANVRAKLISIFGDLNGVVEMPRYSMNGKSKGQLEDEAARFIVRPSVTFVGMSTPNTFYDSLNSASIHDGFLNRMMIVNTRLPRQLSKGGKWASLPKTALKWLKRYGRTGIIEGPSQEDFVDKYGFNIMEDPRQPDDPEVLHFTPQADDRQREIEKEALEISRKWKKLDLADIWVRSHELTLRIALIVALSDDAEDIEVEHLNWAWDYVRFYTNEMAEAARTKIGSNAFVRLAEFFADFVYDAGEKGATIRELARSNSEFNSYNIRDRNEILNRLKTDHNIGQYVSQGKRGPKTELFIHADFAPKNKRRGRDDDLA